MKFGEILRQLRKEKNINQNALAEILSVSQRQVSGYENNEAYPQIPVLVTLADYFDVTIDYLLGRSDKRSFLSSKGTLDYSFKFNNSIFSGKLNYVFDHLPNTPNKKFIFLKDSGNILTHIVSSKNQSDFISLVYLLNLRLGINYNAIELNDNFDILIDHEGQIKSLATAYDTFSVSVYDIRYTEYVKNSIT